MRASPQCILSFIALLLNVVSVSSYPVGGRLRLPGTVDRAVTVAFKVHCGKTIPLLWCSFC